MLLYRQPSHGTQTHTTPTSVLDTSTTPDPLVNHPRYVKVAELGLGSSAFVLLAEDTKRMKDVAIKFINRASNRCGKSATLLLAVSSTHDSLPLCQNCISTPAGTQRHGGWQNLLKGAKSPHDSACMHAASRQQAERSSTSGCAATTLTSFSSKKSSSRQSIWQSSVSMLLEGTLWTSLSATTLLMTGLSQKLKPGGCSSS